MAGKKRRSRKNGRQEQYARRKAGLITEKNKKARKLKHEKLVTKNAERTTKTAELFEKVCAKYELNSKGKYALKRLIGTPNHHRLSCVLDKTLSEQAWFKKRYSVLMPLDKDGENRVDTNASKLIKNTKLRVFL